MWKLWLPLALLLVSCADEVPKAVRTTKVDRVAKAEVQLSKTPVPRTYNIQGNQLQVLDVPVADSSGFVESQRCFVYRDAEFKTATMSCPQQAEVLISSQ
ncbi:MAG: hypothetical protein V4730_11650 [Pseudomonadota bacterium]